MSEFRDKLKELDEAQVANLYKKIFDTPEGKLMLEDLKNRCNWYLPSIDEHTGKTYYNEGMRSVVLHIESQINFRPE